MIIEEPRINGIKSTQGKNIEARKLPVAYLHLIIFSGLSSEEWYVDISPFVEVMFYCTIRSALQLVTIDYQVLNSSYMIQLRDLATAVLSRQHNVPANRNKLNLIMTEVSNPYETHE
jgi:hypothetical protein